MIGSHLTPLAISTRLPPQIPSLIAPRLPINLFLLRRSLTPLRRSSTSRRRLTPRLAMAARDYEAALNCLSSLITRRIRADVSNKGDSFYVMFDYLKMLDLEEEVQKLKVVHVAGTKGKGSTCTFTESILRNCGFHTGLFTSPHLIDVRERFRLDGAEISEEKFLEYFWWCWDRFQERTGGDVSMPIYFRFLTLLAFKIFIAEKVDVAVLEVGLGGKFDSTNVVQAPIVCGISSLGYDHMEILGNTLGEIAGEKAGIFKQGVPAYTMPQPEEAMSVLEAKASELGISLQVVPPLDIGLLKGQRLGLDGEHQYLNAGLAVALSRTWLQRTGHTEDLNLDHADSLPDPFIRGLVMAHLQGRAQIVPDQDVMTQNQNFSCGGLVYYLDGAHSPESIEMCARWFSHVSGKNTQQSDDSKEQYRDYLNTKRILLFNCMSVRDPQLLLPRLVNTCAHHDGESLYSFYVGPGLGCGYTVFQCIYRQGKCVHFDKALFVPNQSLFNKVGSHASVPAADSQQVDLSWQLALQRVWESLNHGENESSDDKIKDTHEGGKSAEVTNAKGCKSSLVFPSIPLALKWIKETVQQSPSIRFQVLVTGSLHLVGDVLKLIKR